MWVLLVFALILTRAFWALLLIIIIVLNDVFFRIIFAFIGCSVIVGTLLEGYEIYRVRHGKIFDKSKLSAKFFLGFGLYGNISKWLNTNIPKGAGHLTCLDGIRFISMSWVVLAHVWSNGFNLNLRFPMHWIIVSSYSIQTIVGLLFTLLCNF